MRVAVFVDAGYVYTQGSKLISDLDNKISRQKLEIDANKIAARLSNFATTVSGKKELLRIYWYDGARQEGLSPEQIKFSGTNDIKLRLGQVNAAGQQKGVDSLIVTDLTDLARNKAISDAVVLSGDEDLRVGVQIAQSLGVRVHLLGLDGTTNSQSLSLQQEADTVTQWKRSEVAIFLKIHGTNEVTESKKVIPKISVAPATKSTPKPAQVDATSMNTAVQRTFNQIKQEVDKFERAVKAASEGKDLSGSIVTILKSELFKFNNKNPTKLENKAARDALGKKLREAT
jgi:uncharacterized LabA/DUF88 family protein